MFVVMFLVVSLAAGSACIAGLFLLAKFIKNEHAYQALGVVYFLVCVVSATLADFHLYSVFNHV